jgi:formylglycine-generating enzyme required for sulfatase activity
MSRWLYLLLPAFFFVLGCSEDDEGRLGPKDFVYAGEVVLVESGDFTMGHESGAPDLPHFVSLTNDFYMGRTEVTNAQYCSMLNWAYDNGLLEEAGSLSVRAFGVQLINLFEPTCEIKWDGEGFVVIASNFEFGDYGPAEAYPHSYNAFVHPVKEVTWYGAACYCDWLSIKEGVTPFYNGDWTVGLSHSPYDANGYRLPTEAEWEYTARYNDARIFPWGHEEPNCSVANYFANSWCVAWTTEVGSYSAGESPLGCFDMAGNVWEWCNDRYDVLGIAAQVNPFGPTTRLERVARGGSWISERDDLRTFSRFHDEPVEASMMVGFRIQRAW